MTVVQARTLIANEEITADEELFKNAMRHLAGAVSVITVGQGEDRTGFTATSVSSLSVDPPSILVSLNRGSSSWPTIQRWGNFCVNMLAHDQQHVADRFAGRGGVKGTQRYEGAQWHELVTGTLGLADALASLDCELEEAIDRHSHAILIGRVRAITVRPNVEPLLYWHGGYRHIATPQTKPLGCSTKAYSAAAVE
jgi:flavin reductase (DIM6/NTAB) family NADH-FMN oxidoreductase RutF